MASQERTLDFVQALRGIAALIVVVYHGARFISPYFEGWGWRLFGSGGSMGVDLFFVISGFIMAYTTRHADGTPRYAYEFAVKRLARIWPAYVVASLLYVVSTRGWGWITANTDTVLETLTFVPLSFDTPTVIHYPSLAVGWTLNYEMHFYFVFAVSLLCGR